MAPEAPVSAEATAASFPSLRRRTLWQVMLPLPLPLPLPLALALALALTWLLGTAVVVGVAYIYTRQAFDRSMLDDAHAIAASVSERDGQLAFSLAAREVGQVLFDRDERVCFAVLRADGSLLAWQGGLRDGLLAPTEPWFFGERHYRSLDLRMVTLARSQPQPYWVVVAQATRSRTLLVQQLLAASVAPQAVLLLLGLWLRRSIARERLIVTSEARDSLQVEPLAIDTLVQDLWLRLLPRARSRCDAARDGGRAPARW